MGDLELGEPVQAGGVPTPGLGGVLRRDEDVGALRADEQLAIDYELVALRLAPEDGMVLQDQARLAIPFELVESMGGAESGEPAADHDQVEDLAGVGDIGRDSVVTSIPQVMRDPEHLGRVAVRGGVVPHSAVPVPGLILRG